MRIKCRHSKCLFALLKRICESLSFSDVHFQVKSKFSHGITFGTVEFYKSVQVCWYIQSWLIHMSFMYFLYTCAFRPPHLQKVLLHTGIQHHITKLGTSLGTYLEFSHISHCCLRCLKDVHRSVHK